MQRIAQMAPSMCGETQNKKEVLPVAEPGKKTTPFHQTTPCGNKNPDAVADITLKVPPGTEKRKWWEIFSSKPKKTKAVSGDTKKQRDGHKKKNWWKPFKFIKNQITSRNDENVEENNDLDQREPEVITDPVTASPKIVEPIKLSLKPTEIANNDTSLKLENIDGNQCDRKDILIQNEFQQWFKYSRKLAIRFVSFLI
ncbi:hypothetical protein GHT06_018348 [Daphnia sinensis]|uniref:Uncharacterized protein n=1 Tax=Daphnia sinensis TaxID=1820382 RepID=A0AAD5KME2_9CRUS|nr:hypothetical protein GHT06_018348 [Daphnia sinensis]